ncbi:MAG TPA: rhomboid family intramembrane serine protease [Clostridiaceae bacterium]
MKKSEQNFKILLENMCKYFGYSIFQTKHEVDLWGIEKEVSDGKIIKAVFYNQAPRESSHSNDDNIKVIAYSSEENYNDILNIMGPFIVIDVEKNTVISFSDGLDRDFINELEGSLDYQRRVALSKNESKKYYFITYILISINVFMFIISAILSQSVMSISTNVLISLGAKVDYLIASGEVYRLITCMFLHGGLMHIVLNMYALYAIGPLIEKVYGRKAYIILYMLSGILSSLFSFVFSPSVSIGASGAIFGLMGAVLIYAFKYRSQLGRKFLNNISMIIAINLAIGITLMSYIDIYAHIGGLIGGIIISFIFLNKKQASN